MKKFKITVNGKTYDVEVEEIKENIGSKNIINATPKEPSVAPQPETKVEQPKKPQSSTLKGSSTVNAPMPGTVLDVKVKEGQEVKKGDVLLILEAMKMENEIMASNDGVVASINVSKGSSVNTGDVLLTLK